MMMMMMTMMMMMMMMMMMETMMAAILLILATALAVVAIQTITVVTAKLTFVLQLLSSHDHDNNSYHNIGRRHLNPKP